MKIKITFIALVMFSTLAIFTLSYASQAKLSKDANYEKALKLIKKSLKEMTINITDEEIENAKKSLSTSLNMIIDNPSSIINNYLFRNVANLKTVEERLEQLKNITVDQIKTYAKNVKINTVYMVSGVE